MNADRFPHRIASAFILILLGTLSACAPTATPTLFRPPSGFISPTPPLPELPQVAPPPVFMPSKTSPPAPTEIFPTPACTDNLTWLSDLTYADNTVVLPGQSIDKQWLIQNNGSCDWDARYRLRRVGGESLGVPDEIPLYPARAGIQVSLRIIFTAPFESGTYRSEWQAVNPDGTFFGNAIYILIIVTP